MKNLYKHIRQSWKAKKGEQELISIGTDMFALFIFIFFYVGLIFWNNEEDLKTIYSTILMISVMRLIPFYLDIDHFKSYYKELISKIRAKDYNWDINLNIVFLDAIVYLMILPNFFVIVDWSYVKYGAAKIGSGVLAVLLINAYKMIKRIREERKTIKKK